MAEELRARLRRARPIPLLVFFAAIAIFPLLLNGPSCGHDYGFHMQSWMDASEQLRAGTPLPHWAFSPAFNAGEPRFIFYPPLSWLLGSLLLLLLPGPAVTTAFTFLALLGAAASMYALARRFTSPQGALLAAAVYTGNPYLFFTTFERTAYAELLAAAWMPLLFRAALSRRLSAPSLALPLALLWLTNAPAAVMGSYALLLLLCWRLLSNLRRTQPVAPAQPEGERSAPALRAALGGFALGLALPAFYLLPAAFERRYVQIAMAIIPNMRVEDNFLFGHTGYGPHDQVLHTASLVALAVASLTALILPLAYFRQRGRSPFEAGTASLLPLLSLLALLIVLLLLPFTLPVWHHVPELAFLQFPWRLLAVLDVVLGLAVALAFPRLELRGFRGAAVALVAIFFVVATTAIAYPPFRQGCEVNELPAERIALYRAHHGVGPTDEYTPGDADNDALRWHDPAYWLTDDPNAPAPGTVPNPAATDPNYDALPPMRETISGRAPMHLQLQLPTPRILVLNLRDYPAWRLTLDGSLHPQHLERDDGLLAVRLPAGASTIDLAWRTLPDVWAGDALSLSALLATATLAWRSRKIGS